MIVILTKTRHIKEIQSVIPCKIYTRFNIPKYLDSYDLGVSYNWTRLVKEPELSKPELGWINYHPAPLPEYRGGDPYTDAVNDKVMEWGVTVHYMNKEYDKGEIIKVNRFPLHHPPISRDEIGAIAHYFLFNLFKDTIKQLSMPLLIQKGHNADVNGCSWQ